MGSRGSEREGSSKNVVWLGLVSLFTDISSEMTFSILPTFFYEQLRIPRALIGLIEGVAEAASYVFRMLSGLISDRIGRRKAVVFAGYAFSNVVKPLFAFASTWVDALAIRFSDRVGKGVRTAPRDALLASSVSERRVGRAFGLHRTLDQSGAVIGPFLALLLVPLITARGVFLASFIPGLLALLILVFFVQERASRPQGAKLLGNVGQVLQGRFPLLLAVVSLFSIGAFDFSFVLLAARDWGVPEALIPGVYLALNVAHAALGIPAGITADRIGRERALLLGYSAFAATSLALVVLDANPFNAFVVALAYGVYMGIVETVQRAVIPRYAPEGLRGTAYGVYYLTVGVSFLAANFIVGFLWDAAGRRAAFTYSLVTSLVAAAALLYFTVARKLRVP
ncbi:MAG: MFS transporter [Candidatus Bathyarchaeia archaeon]